MEQDRYKGHHKLYILGIVCLVLCLSLFFFSMYVLPFLLWGINYDVPGFVIDISTFFETVYRFSSTASSLLTWLFFFVPSLITGFISYYVSNHIDNQLLGMSYGIEEAEDSWQLIQQKREERRDSIRLGLKILFLMIVFVVAILSLQLIL